VAKVFMFTQLQLWKVSEMYSTLTPTQAACNRSYLLELNLFLYYGFS